MEDLKKRVLVVDDSAIMGKLTCKNVESLGYEVDLRANSTAAISYIGNNKTDIILMDIELADSRMDGIETAKMIRRKFQIPVIFITGHEDASIFKEANLNTIFDVVMKPYDIKQLRMQMEVAIFKNKIEVQLKELEKWHQAIMDRSELSVVSVNADYGISNVNSKAAELFDTNRLDLKGKNFFELTQLVPFSKKRDMKPVKSFSEISQYDEKELWSLKIGKKEIMCRLHLTPVNSTSEILLGNLVEIEAIKK